MSKFSFLSTTNRFRYALGTVFGKYLLLTNTLSTGVLMLIGDMAEQNLFRKFTEKEKGYDYGRLSRMFLVGLSMGPIYHYYYTTINRRWPWRDLVSVSKKILADQTIMSPICITQFFYVLGLFERRPLKEMNEEFSKKFVTIYTVDWCVWPPTQFINFTLIPYKFQVIYINVFTVFYNIFLAYVKYEL